MTKKDDRNLSITIKNQTEEKDFIVSFSTFLKKLRKYLLLWIITAVVFCALSFGYAAVTTSTNKVALTALIGFSYTGIEKGLDPKGRDYDVNTIKSPAYIEAALTELGIDVSKLESIREGIIFSGVLPKDTVQRLTVFSDVLKNNGSVSAAEKVLETTYFPTQFRVTFNYSGTGLSDIEAVEVFNTLLENYKNSFYETYGYNSSLGNALTVIDYNDYDYAETIDVFNNSLATLSSYVKQLSNEDKTRFRSSVTGYTFGDLYESIDNVKTIDLDKLSSYISVNNITKDKEEALAYCEYRIKELNRRKLQYEEEIKFYNESISKYEKDQIIIMGTVGDENTQTSISSEQYDTMFAEMNETASSLAQVKQNINYYKERQEALKSNKIGSVDKIEKVEADLSKLNDKVNNFINLVSETSEDYYKNVTFKNAYNVLAPATYSSSDRVSHILENAKSILIVLESLAVLLYLAVAFIEAFITDNRNRKSAKLATELARYDKIYEAEEKDNSELDNEDNGKKK